MRVLNWFVMFTTVLSILVLASPSYKHKFNAAGSAVSHAAIVASAGNGSTLVALPSFAPLVQRDVPAVVNVSTAQNDSDKALPLHDLPGIQPGDPLFEFFRCKAPAEQMPGAYAVVVAATCKPAEHGIQRRDFIVALNSKRNFGLKKFRKPIRF
jgi:hypothetical protein